MNEHKPLRLAMVRCGALQQQHHLSTLCQYLVSQGIELEFFSLQAPASEVAWFGEQVPMMRVHALGQWGDKGIGRFFRGGNVLRSALKKLRFDILYVVDSWTLRYLAVTTMGRMRWRECPLVYHTFDMLVPHVAARAEILLERHATRRSQLNINTDRSRAALTKALFGLAQTPLAIPLRLSRDSVLPTRDDVLRTSLLPDSVDGEMFLIVSPTSLSSERLSKEIIQAFVSLPDNYHLVTVDGTGVYAQECHDLIEELDLVDRVCILEPMPHDDLLKICACADVGMIFYDVEASLGNYFCHPSRLAYFVALGLPVVATDVPVLESVVYRYSLGVCCSPSRVEAIAEAIREMCEGAITLAERRNWIRDAFEQELNYEQSAYPLLVNALYRLNKTSGQEIQHTIESGHT